MKRILVFKTAEDQIVMKLLEEQKEDRIDIMIPSNDVKKYELIYPCINYLEIASDSFYEINQSVIEQISAILYDRIYITLTGRHEHDFGHVLEILTKCRYKRAFFYNCDGEYMEIPRYSLLTEMVISLYFVAERVLYKQKKDRL